MTGLDRRYDAIVIGAGHNGLVTAAYLAKAGLRTLVLERRDEIGGALAVSDTIGRLSPSVVRTLQLERHGLRTVSPEVRAFVPALEEGGRGLTLWADPRRTAQGIRPADAEAFAAFDRRVRSLASFMAYIATTIPPDVKAPSLVDALGGVRLARAYRRLGHRAGRELLRVLPMPVFDFVSDAFDDDVLRAAIAVRGIRYTSMSPRAAGTTAVLLMDSMGGHGAAGETTFAIGGSTAVAAALEAAARSFGAEVRTGVSVDGVMTQDERVTGVRLSDGQEVRSAIVVSNADPNRTILDLLSAEDVGPTLRWRASNIRQPGAVAKVRLTLSSVPRFNGATDADLHGRIVMTDGLDHLERAADDAKYGRVSSDPYLEATIPSLSDPSQGVDGRHVMNVLVQYAPYELREGDWSTERDGLSDLVLKTLERYAPRISDVVVDRGVVTPFDLERDYGLTGGHPLHAEPGLDQFFAWRPLWGHARYARFAGIDGLYLCGSGAHPGGGVTGQPGRNTARVILTDVRRATQRERRRGARV